MHGAVLGARGTLYSLVGSQDISFLVHLRFGKQSSHSKSTMLVGPGLQYQNLDKALRDQQLRILEHIPSRRIIACHPCGMQQGHLLPPMWGFHTHRDSCGAEALCVHFVLHSPAGTWGYDGESSGASGFVLKASCHVLNSPRFPAIDFELVR